MTATEFFRILVFITRINKYKAIVEDSARKNRPKVNKTVNNKYYFMVTTRAFIV